MWTFIIIVVALIFVKFLIDTANQSSKIKSEGGIRRKYATLIDYLLSGDERSRIFQNDNTMVAVGIRGHAGSQIYYIYPAYGNVKIRMEIRNNPLLGNVTKEWTFPENMKQENMIMRMNADTEDMMKEFANRFGDGIL